MLGVWPQVFHLDNPHTLAAMLKNMGVRRQTAWLFANNHFEGSAPLTIDRINERLGT